MPRPLRGPRKRTPEISVEFCPHCGEKKGYSSAGKTQAGKRLYRCHACDGVFEEQT
jgi:transposase-like protein